jgi:hypothetical protein
VKGVEVSGDTLRVLVDCGDDTSRCEAELRAALTTAGQTVIHVRPAATDLEMAFATLIPTALEGSDGPAAGADGPPSGAEAVA